MRWTRPPSWSIRIGASRPDGLAQAPRQRPHLRGRVDVAPEQDEAPRLRVPEERVLVGGERRAGASSNKGAGGHCGRKRRVTTGSTGWGRFSSWPRSTGRRPLSLEQSAEASSRAAARRGRGRWCCRSPRPCGSSPAPASGPAYLRWKAWYGFRASASESGPAGRRSRRSSRASAATGAGRGTEAVAVRRPRRLGGARRDCSGPFAAAGGDVGRAGAGCRGGAAGPGWRSRRRRRARRRALALVRDAGSGTGAGGVAPAGRVLRRRLRAADRRAAGGCRAHDVPSGRIETVRTRGSPRFGTAVCCALDGALPGSPSSRQTPVAWPDARLARCDGLLDVDRLLLAVDHLGLLVVAAGRRSACSGSGSRPRPGSGAGPWSARCWP